MMGTFMQTPDLTVTGVEFRCVIVRTGSHRVLAIREANENRLPIVMIPSKTRPALALQHAMREKFGLDILVLEAWIGFPKSLAAVELLTQKPHSSFTEIALHELSDSELSHEERRYVQLLCEGATKSPFARLGWIEEAVDWFEFSTRSKVSSQSSIEQWNAGGGFALLRMRSSNGRCYWLKATGEPNTHEFRVTHTLCEAHPEFFPKLVAIKREWNAWLVEDAGDPLSDPPSFVELLSAAIRLANLQVLTVNETGNLLAAGAWDQRLPVLKSHIGKILTYLIEAMARQTSTRAVPMSQHRLHELGEILFQACDRLEAVSVPDTLIHNDLNPGNILSDGENLVFTDWSEATVGNPFLSCERLCQLNRVHAEGVRSVYREYWSRQLSPRSMEEVLVLTPLIAIYAYLYGRGDWLEMTESVQPEIEGYRRTLARQMDQAARNPSLLEVLCH